MSWNFRCCILLLFDLERNLLRKMRIWTALILPNNKIRMNAPSVVTLLVDKEYTFLLEIKFKLVNLFKACPTACKFGNYLKFKMVAFWNILQLICVKVLLDPEEAHISWVLSHVQIFVNDNVHDIICLLLFVKNTVKYAIELRFFTHFWSIW